MEHLGGMTESLLFLLLCPSLSSEPNLAEAAFQR